MKQYSRVAMVLSGLLMVIIGGNLYFDVFPYIILAALTIVSGVFLAFVGFYESPNEE